ncbi:helix-turn-helix transcriptional regulator [Granulosicoccus antarcticus]|uniref:HTH deoR-type domain-containing protein n=1 Tax=Granulosicoccus antarcticus IMCC3135 TaxID=1192854 RepID=A0A2Z2NU69_9GAMM|nr:YafY family protein [Granulosicoccus antarcticus]ASJ73278.1 hypothetical protein IMCC3135_15980 [Granulosicoccus antarcticus IMCC3135]
MRADRLINILTTLQACGRATASGLAAENNVSLRTIYRDIDALTSSGIPVYAERGSQGGYRLLNGYKVQLNGMSSVEASALFLSGLGDTATGLGLDAAILSAERKFAAALPQAMRNDMSQLRKRFHLDAPGWFNETEQPVFLQATFEAVWHKQRLRIRYRSWRREQTIDLAPLGIVLKGGAWYLVAQSDKNPRTYKISRILSLEVPDGSFSALADFDLAKYWEENTERLDADMHAEIAHVRVSPLGLQILPELCSSYARRKLTLVGELDADGWQEITMPVGSTHLAVSEFLRLGNELEVLSPESLRKAMRTTVQELVTRYAK